MPTLSGPKISMPDVDFNLKGPKLKGDMDVSAPKIEGEIKTPDLDIKAPKVDIEGPKGGFEMPSIKMPSLNIKGPKFGSPDVDINLKGPKLEGDMDVNLPKIKGDIKAPSVDIEGPDLDIEGHKGGFKMPKIKMPTFGMKGPKLEGPDFDVNLPKANIDVKAPKVDIKGPDVDIEGPNAKLKGPKFNMPTLSGPKISMPDVDFNLKGPKLKGDMDVSAPKIEGEIKTPDLDIKAPKVDIEGPKGGFEMPSIKMPSLNIKGPKFGSPDVDINLKGPKFEGDMDVNLPKIKGDIKAPSVGIEGPDFGIDGEKGGIEMPKITIPPFGMKGLKSEGSQFDIKGPKIDLNPLKLDADVKTPELHIQVPKVDLGQVDVSLTRFEGGLHGETVSTDTDHNKANITFPKYKGPKFAMKSLEVNESDSKVRTPVLNLGAKDFKTEVSFPDSEASLDVPDIDINVKGKKGKFKLPKVKGKAKKIEADIETPSADINLDTANINVKKTKAKKTLFGKFYFPDVELDIKSPKGKGDGSLSDGFKSSDTNLHVKGGLGTESANICLQGSDDNIPSVKGASEFSANVSRSATGGLQYPEGTMTFPKLKIPKFGIALPEVKTQEDERNVKQELTAITSTNIESPSASCQVGSQNVDIHSPELKQSEGKVKGKLPKLFGKSKTKGGSTGDLCESEIEVSASGKGSKAYKVKSGEMKGGTLELEGDPRVSLSTKGKSASLDLFKKSKHRPPSMSDEGSLAVSSPSGHLEAEGGDISLDLGGGKVKGKKGKLKFGTFGGFGSKSKGSYEVTLGNDNEAETEESASATLSSKKSRLSSSSSSDSGSKAGLRFPKVELSVSPKDNSKKN
uniref:AHNAK nucleoprotein n=1 Tax=Nothobranchius kuhntae TaxID=321403 RepID=A0A1A8IMK4_NOTKU